MADVRVKDLTTTATQHASDDYFDIDGATNGSRKILASKYAHVDLNSTPAGGYILDGSDDYIAVADDDNLDFGTGDFALSFVLKTPTTLSSRTTITLYEKLATGAGTEAGLSIALNDTNGTIICRFNDSAGGLRMLTAYPSFSYEANKLYHIVFNFDRDTSTSLYVNGVYKSQITAITDYSGSINTTASLRLGNDKNNSGREYKGELLQCRFYNRSLSASEIVKLWNNGKPESSQLAFEDRNASQSEVVTNGDFSLGSGDTFTGWAKMGYGSSTITETMDGVEGSRACQLNIDSSSAYVAILQNCLQFGKKYRVKFKAKSSVAGSSNFRLEGSTTYAYYSLTTDFVEYTTEITANHITLAFIRNGSHPSTYIIIDDVTVTQLGCVAEYLPNYAGKFGWLETQNRLHGSTSGSPITASAGLFEHYKDIKLTVTGNTTLTSVVPKEYRLKGILFNNTTTNTVVINVGTSGGGTDVVNAQSVPAGLTFVSLAKIFSLTADQTLYVSSADWNSASVNVELSMSKY